MNRNPWGIVHGAKISSDQEIWLTKVLERNQHTRYLRQFSSPRTLTTFRNYVPTCSYDELVPWLEHIQEGECDVLFTGRPVAYERTGGSTGGTKLIPYSQEGLQDFQSDIVPWLARTAREYRLSGRVYFSISPATRQPETIGGIPVGLPDTAYLGERAGSALAARTAVPFEVGSIPDISEWRLQTLSYLRAASDLELISVWSPTFLLRLLDEIPDPQKCWPKLKVISCWASGSAKRFADELRTRLPHAILQPKGLLSTEAVVTVPGEGNRPVPASHVFIEYESDGQLFLIDELQPGIEYEIVITTASGLYRYRTNDRVIYDGHNKQGQAVLEFVGRGGLTCDLVGEKLTETFVCHCLQRIPDFSMLIPDVTHRGYVLVCVCMPDTRSLADLEEALCANPQYAYARRLGQLAPLRALVFPDPFATVERVMLERGVRLGDIKPLALRCEEFWLPLFESLRT